MEDARLVQYKQRSTTRILGLSFSPGRGLHDNEQYSTLHASLTTQNDLKLSVTDLQLNVKAILNTVIQ